ncbi:hypothetical protein B7463_g9950, partial [Scytalidium lignicola]
MSEFANLEGFDPSFIWDNLQDGMNHDIQSVGHGVPDALNNPKTVPTVNSYTPIHGIQNFATSNIAVEDNDAIFSLDTFGITNQTREPWSRISYPDLQYTLVSSAPEIGFSGTNELMVNQVVGTNFLHSNQQLFAENWSGFDCGGFHNDIVPGIPSFHLSTPDIDYIPYNVEEHSSVGLPRAVPRLNGIESPDRRNLPLDSVIPNREINESDYRVNLGSLLSKHTTQPKRNIKPLKKFSSRRKKSLPLEDFNSRSKEKTRSACVSWQTQILLTKIRAACEQAAYARGLLGDTSSDPIILFLDDVAVFNNYLDRPEPIVIDQLSTTSTATKSANGEKVPPAVHRDQLNKFVDKQIFRALGPELNLANKGIIKRAQRCAAFLAILYNIDCSRVYEASHTSILESQSFVLETLYSIVYEVQELIEGMRYELSTSSQKPVDYAQVLCALFLLYRSINSHRKLRWTESHLVDINKFLNEFHERTEHALVMLKGAKASFGARQCSIGDSDTPELKKLIQKQPKFVPFITATYEKNSMHSISENNISQAFGPSLIQILEVGVKDGALKDVLIDGQNANQWEEEQLSLLPNSSKWPPSKNTRKRKCGYSTTESSSQKRCHIPNWSSPLVTEILASSTPDIRSGSDLMQNGYHITDLESDPLSFQQQQYLTAEDTIASSFIDEVNENFQWPTFNSDHVARMGSWAYANAVSLMGMKDTVDDPLYDPQFRDFMPRSELTQQLADISNILDF